MNKWGSILIAFMLTLVVLAGCGTSNTSTPADTENEAGDVEQEQTSEVVENSAFPVTITDASGQELTIEKAPETLITLVPSNTEIVYALGLLDKVIAVTDNDDFPSEVADMEKIGGMEFNIEQIIALSPDLVLANAMNNQEGIEQIKNAGIPVLVVNSAASFDEVYESINLIGEATGTVEKAEEIVNGMQASIAAIQEKVASISEEEQVSVFVEIWPDPIYTTGKGTFMDEMLTLLNAKNAAGDQDGWPMFTEEDAVVLDPNVIITTYGHVAGYENAVEDILARSAWTEVDAVQQKRVYNIEANIVERPGPRLVLGVEKLAELIYPDAVK